MTVAVEASEGADFCDSVDASGAGLVFEMVGMVKLHADNNSIAITILLVTMDNRFILNHPLVIMRFHNKEYSE
ncbi:hypothetical protein hrd7_32320 [Leptolinea sp. HRD-7]|nr:hypothetical protein hrd7_32320 [Leptolinea sp. HRD-7]